MGFYGADFLIMLLRFESEKSLPDMLSIAAASHSLSIYSTYLPFRFTIASGGQEMKQLHVCGVESVNEVHSS